MAKRTTQTKQTKQTIEIEVVEPQELTLDPVNRRKRTRRSASMIEKSFHDVGAIRGISVKGDGTVVAGNGVLQNHGGVVKRVLIVDTDAETLVATRRRDLTDEQARRAAMYDNRAGDLAEYDVEQLRADMDTGIDLSPFFTEEELAAQGVVSEADETADVIERVNLSNRKRLVWCLIGIDVDKWATVAHLLSELEDAAEQFYQATMQE